MRFGELIPQALPHPQAAIVELAPLLGDGCREMVALIARVEAALGQWRCHGCGEGEGEDGGAVPGCCGGLGVDLDVPPLRVVKEKGRSGMEKELGDQGAGEGEERDVWVDDTGMGDVEWVRR